MGDMLPHDAVNQEARQPDGSYNYTEFLTDVKPLIASSGIVFCNQEVPSAGEAFGITGYPSFNAPEQFARDLSSFGCNAINTATNHSNDKGQGGIDGTRAVWDSISPLLISGANRSPEEQNTVSFTEVNGIRFALVSFAEYSNSTLSNDYSVNFYGNDGLVQNLMTQARAGADVVLVSMHWGTEYSNGVNSNQQAAAARVAELGADVIIGTGPHVLEPVEWIPGANGKQTLVWYSIGNLLSTQLEIPQLIGGVAQFDAVKKLDGTIAIEAPRFTPTYMHWEWTPEQAAAGDLLARHNLHVYPLSAAADALSRSLFNTSVDEQYSYVRTVLGPVATVE
jgi:poly-gamma-glutamate synthesis protein (capsule biosynthesis protein)